MVTIMINIKKVVIATIASSLIFIQGCATHGGKVSGSNPDQRLDQILGKHNVVLHQPISCHSRDQRSIDCRTLARSLESLMMEFPHAPRILIATAFVQYQLGRTLDSQFTLDQALSLSIPMPEAAVLRSRIAMSDGNFSLAKTIISRHLRLAPDYAPLYETEAASFYFQGRYGNALASLRQAEMLGTPPWRIHYHRGMIHEAMSRHSDACSDYAKVVNEIPGHPMANAKLRILRVQNACS